VTLFDGARSSHTPELAFSAAGLHRAGELRDRAGTQKELMARPDARAIIICADTPVLGFANGELLAHHDIDLATGLGDIVEAAFLGLDGERPVFGLHLAPSSHEALKASSALKLIDMRSIAIQGLFTPDTVNDIGTAKALFSWHARHRFCSNCGAPTTPASAGWKRVCEACSSEHFPRTDPVAIMLAVDGDRCLLGRAPRFPATMFSCLAGFMEPGETFADAVRREIKEEAGVDVGRVRFLDCQPWPFPSSLMIGCLAEATSTTITLDDELADARWFTRDEVRLILAGQHPDGITCPPRMAIANHIMRAFAEGVSGS
jgi:NAD+ diphosphatase